MTRRLNKKLIIVLCACLVVIGAALGGGWFVATHARAASAFREAEAAMADRDYKLAIKRYAKAARHRDYSRNIDLMLSASEAHRQVEVSDMREAWKNLGQMIQWLRMAVRVNPHDDRALQRRMELGMRMGREFGATATWEVMYYDTQELLRQYPDLPMAIKYRGISQVQRMVLASTNLNEQEQTQAGLDLRSALDEFGFERDTVEYLALWHQLKANRLDGPGGNRDKATTHRGEALRLTAKGVADHGDDPQWHVVHISNLLRLDKHNQARSALETLQRLLLQKATAPRVARQTAVLILQLHEKTQEVRDPEHLRRVVRTCANLIRSVLEKHPDNSGLKLALARIHMHLDDRDQSRILYEQVWQSLPPGNPFDFVKHKGYWAEAGIGYLKLELYAARSIEDRKQRDERIAEIEQGLVRIKAAVGDAFAINDLVGQISAVRGNWVKALQEFDKLSDRFGGENVETLMRSAAIRFKLGEWGAAAENYERILEIRPDLTDIRKKLARVYLAGKRLDKAAEQVELILTDQPDDPSVRLLQIESLVHHKKFDEADGLLKQLDADVPTDEAIALGQLYAEAGRNDLARKLFLQIFRRNPSHIAALFSLVNLTQDQSEQQAFIEQSRKAGGDARHLDVVKQFVEGDLDPKEEIIRRRRDALKHLSDPVIDTVRQYERLLGEGDRAAAENVLDELDRNGGIYILTVHNLFRKSLAKKDWQTAEHMAALARDALGGQGADVAKGLFYLGRLDMTRGRFDQAVVHFRAGLEQRRIYSHGWRMLGDALLEIKEFESAIAAYRTAVSQRPDNLQALVSLARAYDQRGQPDEAVNILRQAYQYNPEKYSVANVYLDFELRHGNADRALHLRRQIAQSEPDNLHNRRAVVATLAHMRRKQEAARALKKLIADTGSTTENNLVASRVLALTHGSATAAGSLMRSIKDKNKQVTSDDYRHVGRRLMELGNETYALSAYRQAIRTEDPEIRPATRELADMLANTRDGAKEAAALYEKLSVEFPSEVRIIRAHVLMLLKTNRLDEAESKLKQLVASHGEDLAALMLSAQLHAQRGQLDEAMAACDRAIEQAPHRASLYVTKASLVAGDPQRYGEALSIVDRALELDPRLASARQIRSRIHHSQGDVDAAIREYEQLLDKSPRHHSARLELATLYDAASRFRKLQMLLAESAKLFATDPIWPQRQAAAALRNDDTDTALKYLERVFELDPKPSALFTLVSFQMASEKPADALKTLETNETLMKSDPRLQAQRGRALSLLGRDQEATAVFIAALQQAKNVDQTLTTRNQIASVRGHAGASRLMLTAYGDSPPFIAHVAIAELIVRDRRFDSAVLHLAELVPQVDRVSKESQILFYQTYAVALHRAGNSEQAESAYRQLLELRPNDATALNNLAFLLVNELGRPAEAVVAAERALRLWPRSAAIMDTLGWSLFKTGEVDRSRRLIESCYRLRPSAEVSLHLAEVLEHLGLTKDAVDVLKSGRTLAERSRDQAIRKQIDERLERLSS